MDERCCVFTWERIGSTWKLLTGTPKDWLGNGGARSPDIQCTSGAVAVEEYWWQGTRVRSFRTCAQFGGHSWVHHETDGDGTTGVAAFLDPLRWLRPGSEAVLLAALARMRAQRHTLTHSALDEYYGTPLSSDHFALDVFLEELVTQEGMIETELAQSLILGPIHACFTPWPACWCAIQKGASVALVTSWN